MILFRKAFHIPKITHQYSRYYRADRLVPLQQSQKLNVNNLLQLHEFSKNIPSDIISLIIFPFYRIPLRNYFYYLLFSWNSLVKDQGTKKKKKIRRTTLQSGSLLLHGLLTYVYTHRGRIKTHNKLNWTYPNGLSSCPTSKMREVPELTEGEKYSKVTHAMNFVKSKALLFTNAKKKNRNNDGSKVPEAFTLQNLLNFKRDSFWKGYLANKTLGMPVCAQCCYEMHFNRILTTIAFRCKHSKEIRFAIRLTILQNMLDMIFWTLFLWGNHSRISFPLFWTRKSF